MWDDLPAFKVILSGLIIGFCFGKLEIQPFIRSICFSPGLYSFPRMENGPEIPEPRLFLSVLPCEVLERIILDVAEPNYAFRRKGLLCETCGRYHRNLSQFCKLITCLGLVSRDWGDTVRKLLPMVRSSLVLDTSDSNWGLPQALSKVKKQLLPKVTCLNIDDVYVSANNINEFCDMVVMQSSLHRVSCVTLELASVDIVNSPKTLSRMMKKLEHCKYVAVKGLPGGSSDMIGPIFSHNVLESFQFFRIEKKTILSSAPEHSIFNLSGSLQSLKSLKLCSPHVDEWMGLFPSAEKFPNLEIVQLDTRDIFADDWGCIYPDHSLAELQACANLRTLRIATARTGYDLRGVFKIQSLKELHVDANILSYSRRDLEWFNRWTASFTKHENENVIKHRNAIEPLMIHFHFAIPPKAVGTKVEAAIARFTQDLAWGTGADVFYSIEPWW